MNEIIKNIISRRSIRRYKPEQISQGELDAILNAGLYAPCAGGRQSAIIAVCQNQKINNELGKINRSIMPIGTPAMGRVSFEQPSILDDGNIKSAFYGAPTVLTLFAPKNFSYAASDCSVMAQSIMLAAHSIGIGSCLVMRAEDTFSSELGQKLQKEWGIDESYQAKAHIVLGYPAGSTPSKAKQRKESRIRIVN